MRAALEAGGGRAAFGLGDAAVEDEVADAGFMKAGGEGIKGVLEGGEDDDLLTDGNFTLESSGGTPVLTDGLHSPHYASN